MACPRPRLAARSTPVSSPQPPPQCPCFPPARHRRGCRTDLCARASVTKEREGEESGSGRGERHREERKTGVGRERARERERARARESARARHRAEKEKERRGESGKQKERGQKRERKKRVYASPDLRAACSGWKPPDADAWPTRGGSRQRRPRSRGGAFSGSGRRPRSRPAAGRALDCGS